ncbi:hypothetical protein BC830DRAFT_1172352 [Chytriomyces sp. MP71]|nr:hypothetical protein BC830DRAFT_1172352 [Chytriomyces sp. MP71]
MSASTRILRASTARRQYRAIRAMFKNAGFAVFLYAAWQRRRTLPGLIAYILLWSLPHRIMARLLGLCDAPKQLDTFTAAIIKGLNWVTEGPLADVYPSIWDEGPVVGGQVQPS